MKLLTEWAVTSSILILIVLAARLLLKDRLSARLRYALWGVVLLRLLVPFQVELPAQVSDSLPLLASNVAPRVERWEEPSIPVFPQEDFAAFGLGRADIYRLEPGEIIPTNTSIGYWQKSQDGETITRYLDLWSPAQVVTVIWGVGAGLAVLVILTSNLRFGRRLRKRRKPLEGVDAPILVYAAEGLPSPCLTGMLRPAVYVTPQAAEDPDTLRHVLAHELTHYKHGDSLWSLLRCLALALHWYNPLVWLAVVLSKGDGELACDEGAVARLGEEERIPYGRTLVDMVAKRSLRPGDLLSCSTAMTGGGKSVKQRVAALVKKPETVKTALFVMITVVALSTVFVFAGRAQPDLRSPNFLGYVEIANSVRYSPPLYSSQFYPAITDLELLSRAKEALSGVAYLGEDDPRPNLHSSELFHASRVALPNEGAENLYTMLWQNDRTYLLVGDTWRDFLDLQEAHGETAQLVGQSGILVSKPGVNLIAVLSNLAAEQQGLSMDTVALLDAELEHYAEVLLRERGIQLQGRPNDSESAKFHAGCLNKKSGEVELWYRGDSAHDGVWVVGLSSPALMSAPDQYVVQADLPVEVFNAARNAGREEAGYEQLGPGAFAAFLRPEDVISVTAGDYDPGQVVELDVQTLKEQLVQGLYHKRSAEYDEEKYGQYCLTIQVEKDVDYYLHDGGADGLILSAGSEPDVVCLSHRILASPQDTMRRYVYSPELYRTLRDLFD